MEQSERHGNSAADGLAGCREDGGGVDEVEDEVNVIVATAASSVDLEG